MALPETSGVPRTSQESEQTRNQTAYIMQVIIPAVALQPDWTMPKHFETMLTHSTFIRTNVLTHPEFKVNYKNNSTNLCYTTTYDQGGGSNR